jgi:hypothetical protein
LSQPGYWMHESTGALRPAVEAYLRGEDLTPEEIAALRAYLRQWISAPVWRGDDVDRLRRLVDSVVSRPTLTAWLAAAEEIGIDPL